MQRDSPSGIQKCMILHVYCTKIYLLNRQLNIVLLMTLYSLLLQPIFNIGNGKGPGGRERVDLEKFKYPHDIRLRGPSYRANF